MMEVVKLTPARLRALEVIAAQEAKGPGVYARYSNETNLAAGTVYWQSADWLVKNELAWYPSGSTWLVLTEAGRTLAAAHRL